MEDAQADLTGKVQQLSDLELACLVCLVADQPCCIIETDADDLTALEKDLVQVCARTYQLRSAVVRCDETTTCDVFSWAILVKDDGSRDADGGDYLSPAPLKDVKTKAMHRTRGAYHESAETQIANIVITSGLNHAPEQVQIQALELARGRRIFSRKAVHVAPQHFMIISLQRRGDQRLLPLLNDQMFMCHDHLSVSPAYGNDDASENASDADSMASVIRSPPTTPGEMPRRFIDGDKPLLTLADIKALQALTASVTMSTDIRAHLHDIAIYMRNHRAIASGATALATTHLEALSRALAPLHGLAYITPSLVSLAARKIYPHRLVLVAPERERSLQWGSSLEAVQEVLRGVTVEDVIEQVLDSVETPL